MGWTPKPFCLIYKLSYSQGSRQIAASIRRSAVGICAAAAVTRALDFLLGPDDSLLGVAIYANGGIAGAEG